MKKIIFNSMLFPLLFPLGILCGNGDQIPQKPRVHQEQASKKLQEFNEKLDKLIQVIAKYDPKEQKTLKLIALKKLQEIYNKQEKE